MKLKKGFIALSLASCMLLAGCSQDNDVNSSAKNAVEGFLTGIQEYDYATYSKSATSNLLANSSIVIDADDEDYANSIAIYGQKIEKEEFNNMYKSLLGGLVRDFEIGEIAETEFSTVAEASEAENDTIEKEENKDSESKDEKSTAEEKTTDESSSDTEEDTATDSKSTYYKVSAKLTIPSAESITNKGQKIFGEHVDTVFAEKTSSRNDAVQAMIKFFSDSFKDLYDNSNIEEVDTVFYVEKDAEGKFRVNDTDIFDYVFQSYEAANEQVSNSGLYTNDNAYDAYLKITLTDDEYKTYRETGELPNYNADESTDGESSDTKTDSGSSTSWKNNQK